MWQCSKEGTAAAAKHKPLLLLLMWHMPKQKSPRRERHVVADDLKPPYPLPLGWMRLPSGPDDQIRDRVVLLLP